MLAEINTSAQNLKKNNSFYCLVLSDDEHYLAMAVTPLTSVSEENKPANDAGSTASSNCSASNNTQKPFDTDVILGHLGFGWFQIKMIVVLFYGILFPTAAVLIYPFIGFVPRHR